MRETRIFFNGRTLRDEVWLERATLGGTPAWHVTERGGQPRIGERYPDTDEGYAAARADYERRVAERMR